MAEMTDKITFEFDAENFEKLIKEFKEVVEEERAKLEATVHAAIETWASNGGLTRALAECQKRVG